MSWVSGFNEGAKKKKEEALGDAGGFLEQRGYLVSGEM